MGIMDILIAAMKLVLAVVLSGLIGLEREHKHRPAGFKTHILVCVGATLTMMISLYMREKGIETDGSRLGAQVISGIGFLGAGTIIREGANVRGLTTAATLWAVACIGLAVGIGYYIGAIFASLIIFAVLKILGIIGSKLNEQSANLIIHITAKNSPEIIGQICRVLGKFKATVKNMEFISDEETEEDKVMLCFTLILIHRTPHTEIFSAISAIDGVYKVEE
ncbi:MAG: MgtC/SapB family protein [Bacillota bacterium]|nr:MgtC/SapB family protein [Bacillota bacterium]